MQASSNATLKAAVSRVAGKFRSSLWRRLMESGMCSDVRLSNICSSVIKPAKLQKTYSDCCVNGDLLMDAVDA